MLFYVRLHFSYCYLLQVVDHVSRSIEDIKAKFDRAKHASKEKEGINKELLQRVMKLVNKKIEKEEEHVVKI